ncbi:MAG: hypothetical protein ABI378_12055 [Chitinophagaceae bacterium]
MKNLRAKLFFVASISIWMVFVTACTDYEPPHQYVSDGVRAYFDYQIGSYWVMKDSATGVLDSFYVNNYYDDNQSSSEIINMTVVTASNVSIGMDVRFTGVSLHFTNSTVTVGVGYDIAINFPFWFGVHNPDKGQYEMLFYPKKIISGIVRDSVYVACCNSSNPYNMYNDTVYFNRMNGLLRLKFNNSVYKQDWVIQRQNINR